MAFLKAYGPAAKAGYSALFHKIRVAREQYPHNGKHRRNIMGIQMGINTGRVVPAITNIDDE